MRYQTSPRPGVDRVYPGGPRAAAIRDATYCRYANTTRIVAEDGVLARRSKVGGGADIGRRRAVDLKKIAEEAKGIVDKRGGTESLKEDAEELKDILGGSGSLADKAKEAEEAVKDPGAEGPEGQPGAHGKREGDRPRQGGKHRHQG